jgi:hypothetical protein
MEQRTHVLVLGWTCLLLHRRPDLLAIPGYLSMCFHFRHVGLCGHRRSSAYPNRLFAMWFCRAPESPRWLASKGRHEESIAVLAALQNAPVDDPEVLRTWTGIVELNAQSVGDFAIKELFTNGPAQHLRRTMLGIAAQGTISRYRQEQS